MKVDHLDGPRRLTEDLFRDHRGYIRTLHLPFAVNDLAHSFSRYGVLRGIHGNGTTHKILSCVMGEVFHVAVNVATGEWMETWLTPSGPSIYLPPGFGSATLTLTDSSGILYQQSEDYAHSQHQFTYRYNDPRFGIVWPLPDTEFIVSARDRAASLT